MKRLSLIVLFFGVLVLTMARSSVTPAQTPSVVSTRASATVIRRTSTVTPSAPATAHTSLPKASNTPQIVNPSPAVDDRHLVATPTRGWEYHPPGEISVPILLYHHIGESQAHPRYFVSPQQFKAQMSSLWKWGYTTIPISLLVRAIQEGAELPPKPVVITFDDGYREVYQEALPVMEQYGFVGTLYVIQDQVGVSGYLNADQLRKLIESGWEIGSHSKTHANLRKAGVNLVEEVINSRLALESLLSTPVLTFSYPYGSASPYLKEYVQQAGYTSAVGVGTLSRHSRNTAYYLSRLEVRGGYDLLDFSRLLRGENPP